MRILHLISSRGFYGAENVVLNLGKALKKNSHIPYIACLNGLTKPEPEIYSQAQKEGLRSEIITCRHRFDVKAFGNLNKLIKEERIDIIHSHGYKSNFYGLITAKLSKIPIVATLHLWTGETSVLQFYEYIDRRWIIGNIDHLVLVSPTFYEEIKHLKRRSGRITFIPNGIDTDKFDSSKINTNLREEFGIENALVIGNVARFNGEKNHAQLIEVFDKIQAVIPEARLLLIGDGPLRGDLQDMVHSRLLEKKVIFAGIRNDLPSLYKAMDIFVLPSLKEGMPMALLEAMSMELPVIATDVGGVPHVISPDEDGLIIPIKQFDILEEKISLLLRNQSLRKKLGEKARQKVLKMFSMANFYHNYLKVYEKVSKHG